MCVYGIANHSPEDGVQRSQAREGISEAVWPALSEGCAENEGCSC